VVHLAFSREYATNNTAEYEGLLTGLRIAARLGISRLMVRGDCQLVVNQVNKAYDCPQMWAYVDEEQKLERRFDGLKLEHIPRRKNIIADELSQIAAKRLPVSAGIFVKQLTKPSATPRVAVRTSTTPSLRLSRQLPPVKARSCRQWGRILDPLPLLPSLKDRLPLGGGADAVSQVPEAARRRHSSGKDCPAK
jgi:ribonuclease HI